MHDKWEYKVISIGTPTREQLELPDNASELDMDELLPYLWRYLERRLDEHGSEGWEVISAKWGDGGFFAVAKRQKVSQEGRLDPIKTWEVHWAWLTIVADRKDEAWAECACKDVAFQLARMERDFGLAHSMVEDLRGMLLSEGSWCEKARAAADLMGDVLRVAKVADIHRLTLDPGGSSG